MNDWVIGALCTAVAFFVQAWGIHLGRTGSTEGRSIWYGCSWIIAAIAVVGYQHLKVGWA